MNLKKTAIALAVATVAATPIIAAADGKVYASLRYGFEAISDKITFDAGPPIVASGNNSNTTSQFRDVSSRWGIKGENDLGNGMTAYGAFEQAMTDPQGQPRDLKIGVRGDWGDIYMGTKINGAWDNLLTSDSTFEYGGGRNLTEGIQSNQLTYMNTIGTFTFGGSVSAKVESDNAEEETLDQWELAGAWDFGPVALALGVTDETTNSNDPDPTIGLNLAGGGRFNYRIDYQKQDVSGGDKSSIQLDFGFDRFVVQWGQEDTSGSSSSPSTWVLGWSQELGPRTQIFYEYAAIDEDTSGVDTQGNFLIALKVDIL